MTIKQLTKDYKEIKTLLDKKQFIKDPQARIFGKTVKIMEELGELSQEIIASLRLHRNQRNENYKKENLEGEFADVIGSLMILADELNIDVENAVEKKIEETKKRFS